MTGNVAGGVGDALVEHFFGADKGGKLTVEMFGEFHRLLRTELLRLEVRPHPLPRPLLLSAITIRSCVSIQQGLPEMKLSFVRAKCNRNSSFFEITLNINTPTLCIYTHTHIIHSPHSLSLTGLTLRKGGYLRETLPR